MTPAERERAIAGVLIIGREDLYHRSALFHAEVRTLAAGLVRLADVAQDDAERALEEDATRYDKIMRGGGL
jgi:hypothetical protein